MKSRIWKLFLVLIMVISITGCGKEKEKKEETEKEPEVQINNNDALLWEIKSDTATIYLAGATSLANEDTYPLQQKLLDAFSNSKILTIDSDSNAIYDDAELLVEASALMVYNDDSILSDHISQTTYESLKKYVLEYGYAGTKFNEDNFELLDTYKVWGITSDLMTDIYTEAGFDKEYNIEEYFISEAEERDMEIIELEPGLARYKFMDNLSPEIQELLLNLVFRKTREELILEAQETSEAWKKGDIETLERILNDKDELTPAEKELYGEYEKMNLTNRNIVMADKIEELLKGNQNVFYLVSSSNVLREDGIVKLLEKRGYTVTKL